jgi:hypothetical protein
MGWFPPTQLLPIFYTRGLYHKILRTRKVWQMDRYCSKLESFILSVTNTPALTNTLAYYEIHTIRICNVFIVQAPGACVIMHFTAVIVAVSQ